MNEMTLASVACVFVGGGIGSVLRFGISRFSAAQFGGYPYGTLTANLLGSFLAGLAAVLIFERKTFVSPVSELILAGFLGGLTTFSAMILDTHRLVAEHQLITAIVYVALNLIAGFLLFLIAFNLMRPA